MKVYWYFLLFRSSQISVLGQHSRKTAKYNSMQKARLKRNLRKWSSKLWLGNISPQYFTETADKSNDISLHCLIDLYINLKETEKSVHENNNDLWTELIWFVFSLNLEISRKNRLSLSVMTGLKALSEKVVFVERKSEGKNRSGKTLFSEKRKNIFNYLFGLWGRRFWSSCTQKKE